MKKVILVPTVMHSGSHVVRSFFDGWCFGSPESLEYDMENTAKEMKHMIFCHVHEEGMESIKPLLGEYPVFIPMRHPARIYESWVRREENLEELGRQLDVMIDTIDKYDPVYLLIDSEKRDKWLVRANGKLKEQFVTTWPSFTTQHTMHIPVTKAMQAAVPGTVMDFYEQKIQSIEGFL